MSAVCTTDRYAMAGARNALRAWGAICERVRMYNSYPNSDTTYRAVMGRGGDGSHRLPIPDIPTFAVQLSAKVLELPDNEGNAVTLMYCYTFNLAGQWWSNRDKAKILGVCEDTFRDWERAGRSRLLFSAREVMEGLAKPQRNC